MKKHSNQTKKLDNVIGHGYLFSKSNLLEDLRSPFKNPLSSPLKNVKEMYDEKTSKVNDLSNRSILVTLSEKT